MNAEAMPKIFLRTSKLGIPLAGVGVSFCFGLLAFLSVSSGSNQAFVWLSNLSALSSLIGWISICICYLRFKKALAVQGTQDLSPFLHSRQIRDSAHVQASIGADSPSVPGSNPTLPGSASSFSRSSSSLTASRSLSANSTFPAFLHPMSPSRWSLYALLDGSWYTRPSLCGTRISTCLGDRTRRCRGQSMRIGEHDVWERPGGRHLGHMSR